jgi:hypothetical protein
MYEQLGQLFWAGRTLCQAGLVRSETSEREAAAALFRKALGFFEQLGAVRAAASTRRELGTAGE